MKKLLFTSLLLIVFGVYNVHAQANSDLVQWGFKAGVNFANLSGSDVDGSPDSRTGFQAGIVAEVPFTERLSIQPELYYSQQGATTKGEIMGSQIKMKMHLDYIHIAPIFKYYIIQGLNIQVGPQLGFNVNKDVTVETELGNDTSSIDDVNDIDLDIVAGVGYKFDMGVFVNARYMHGFSKVSKDNDVHNSVIQIGVGYMF